VCNSTKQPHAKSNVNSNATAKRHAVVSNKLKLVYKTAVYRPVNPRLVQENSCEYRERFKSYIAVRMLRKGQGQTGPAGNLLLAMWTGWSTGQVGHHAVWWRKV